MRDLKKIGLTVFLIGAFLLGNSPALPDLLTGRYAWAAAKRSGYKGSRNQSGGFSKPYRPPGNTVFGGRSGGGFFGGDSGSRRQSGGFSKPPSTSAQRKSQTPQSGGFRKPGNTPKAGQAGGFSKPATPFKPGLSNSGGFAKPGARQSPAQTVRPNARGSIPSKPLAGSVFDQKMTQAMKQHKANDSIRAYRAENQKFKNPAPADAVSKESYSSNPIYNQTKNYGAFNYKTHYSQRDDYYRQSGWSPPQYVYNGRPSFGMWDALLLWSILDRTNDPKYVALAHNQANDPGYQQWRKEADRQAETNADLKAKLAKLDAQLEKMKGQPVNPGYLPEGVPQQVAISADALKAKPPEKPKLRIATGPEGGDYFFYGNLLKKYAKGLDVEVLPTAGSMENLRKLIAGEADMAIVQSDVLALLGKEFPGSKLISEQAVIYKEAVQMVANKAGGVKDVNDLRAGKHTLYIGPEGSGTAMTWEGFVLQDPGYKSIKTANAPYEEALQKVVQDPDNVMMFVGGLNNNYLKDAEELAAKTRKLRLVAVDDWDFNNKRDDNGNRIYEFVKIGRKVYPNLQKGLLWGSNAVETISVQAVGVVRTEWVKQYGSDAMDVLSFAVMEASPVITKKVNTMK